MKIWESNKQENSKNTEFHMNFLESLSYDRRLYAYDIKGSCAHVKMLAETGIIEKEDAQKIAGALREIQQEIDKQGDSWPGWQKELEDIHMCIEAALIGKIGDTGRKLHTGRSRNDQVMLDILLWAKDAVKELEKDFHALALAFTELADKYGTMVMPSYTHLQRAQPIVLGGELVAWLEAFDRCKKRFALLEELNNRNPLGAGAIAGSSLPLNRQLVSEYLGIGEPARSSIDATASRDLAADFLYSLAMTMMTLSRWAEQWILYNTKEFAFIQLDERFITGSSMMPQKQNPDFLELIRGRCGNVYGYLVAMLTSLKGLPLGYNRDLQEDKRLLFASYDTVRACLQIAAQIAGSVRFNEEAIASSIDTGYTDATILAEYFVKKGLPFRTAHQLVGCITRYCMERSIKAFSLLSYAQFGEILKENNIDAGYLDENVLQNTGADNAVKQYKTFGNAGLSGYREQIAYWKKKLHSRE